MDFVKVEVKIDTNEEAGCNSNDRVEVKKEPVPTNEEGLEVIFTELEHESDNNNENYLDYIYTEASFLQSVSGVNSDLLGALIDIELQPSSLTPSGAFVQHCLKTIFILLFFRTVWN